MTRSERLAKNGKTDTVLFGVLDIELKPVVLRDVNYRYEMTDFDYNVDIYTHIETQKSVAVLIG